VELTPVLILYFSFPYCWRRKTHWNTGRSTWCLTGSPRFGRARMASSVGLSLERARWHHMCRCSYSRMRMPLGHHTAGAGRMALFLRLVFALKWNVVKDNVLLSRSIESCMIVQTKAEKCDFIFSHLMPYRSIGHLQTKTRNYLNPLTMRVCGACECILISN